MRDVGMYTDLL